MFPFHEDSYLGVSDRIRSEMMVRSVKGMAGGSGRCCASLLVVMLSGLILLGVAEVALYLYVRLILSATLCKTYCWLWAGALTVLFAASVLFLMVSVKKRSGWLVFAHFAVICLLQATSWALSELVEWRLWWNEQFNEDLRVTYVEIYILTTAWQATASAIAAVATLMSCLTYGCSTRSVNLLDVSAKSSNSWEFVRARSSTPKKDERLVHNRMGAAKSANKKYKGERRRLSFKGKEFFGEDDPITPISLTATNAKKYGQVENHQPWRPPTASPDKVVDMSTDRSEDMSTFKKNQRTRTDKAVALYEYEMGVI